MANKHLTEDEIRYTVDVKTADAQKAIYTLEQQSKKLRSENKARLSQMISLEAAGRKETEAYRNLKKQYSDTSKEIRTLTSRIGEQTSKIDILDMSMLEAAGRKETEAYRNLKKQYSDTSKEIRTLTSRIGEQTSKIDILDMSMVQLKKQQKSLQKELDNTVQSLNPEAYGVLEQRLKDVSGRISELKQNAKSFGELASDNTVNGVFLGNLLTKGAELFSEKVMEFKDSIAELVNGGLEMAEQADGVTKAFNDLNQEGLLDNLRKATKGTVNDVQLMTAAVKANDFRIPLEDLGKYLEFAQLKAQQTGQSVDYMTDSIVTGLGRKSPLILDNLGISAAEISEKTKETGDFMKAVAEIVDTQLAAAGETYISAADRIPLEDLGKYLEFAQLKAQQTGQSVDYMTDSIVTGLGRKSPLILDNLGISAAEISEKTKETGDFMKAVAEIVDTQLAEAGETYISAADRAAQKTVELQNAQKALGDEILPLKEQWDDAYADMQLNTISLISWCVKHQGVVKTLGILLTAFTVVAIATSNAIKTNIVVTKGAAAAQQAWNVICATGTGLMKLLQAGFLLLTGRVTQAKAAWASMVTKGAAAAQQAWNVICATGTGLMKLLQAGFLLLTGRVTQAKAAWASMNATMKASVFGLIAAGVALLAMKLWDMKKAADASTLAQKALNNIRAEAQKQVVEEKLKLETEGAQQYQGRGTKTGCGGKTETGEPDKGGER